MNWTAAAEKTVAGLGYELVECERAPRGLLRVYIDRLPGGSYDSGPGEFVTVEDCEKVTRQLQYVLEVEGCNYERLEVSSPGLDRPLKKPADYERFAGSEIELNLKMPFNGRKKFRGVLERAEEGDAWRLVYGVGKAEEALGFTLDEVRDARLVPVLNFKGRAAQDASADAVANEEVDGGRIQ
jgi:ribosome maturation factor RimP